MRVTISAAVVVLVVTGLPAPSLAQHPDLGGEKLVNELCLGCHEDLAKAMGEKPHKAVETGCVTCHDIEKGKDKPFLRTEVNALCLACHHQPAPPPGGKVADRIVIARGYDVPRTALPAVKQLGLNARGMGHPISNHPVSGVADPLKPGKNMTCLSCHVPHGGPSPKLLAFALKPGEGVCQHCHKF